jgi:quaternary ammonium compound-resistance protein SugE
VEIRWTRSPSGLQRRHTGPPRPRAITDGRDRNTQTRGDVMAWLALVAAGLFETAFAVCLKLSNGMQVLWPTVGFAVSALASFGLLTVALRELEVGPAYAVWTGIGAAGAATVGMIFLGDAVSTLKLASIALILVGVVGLNLSGVTP